MRFETEADLQRLIHNRIPESVSLDYKRELHLGSEAQRRKVLRNLTGMANGGGGTILFGIDEERGEESNVATDIVPLSDHSVAGALEDIVRDGVQPSLLVEYQRVAVKGGFVLAVDVRQSPLGPFMVTSYGEPSYFHRSGTSTYPMSERQVRDTYALADRAKDSRGETWEGRRLPLRPSSRGWIVIAGLPEVMGRDMLDMADMEPTDLVPPQPEHVFGEVGMSDLAPVLNGLARWGGGFFGKTVDEVGGVDRVVRIDRDGALSIAIRVSRSVEDAVWTPRVFRALNVGLRYASWVWSTCDLRSAIELRLEIQNFVGRTFSGALSSQAAPDHRTVLNPAGLTIDPFHAKEFVEPRALARSSVRHGLCMRFGDLFHQLLGEKRAEAPFRSGLLYDRAGQYTDHSAAAGAVFFDPSGSGHRARVHVDGAITSHRGGIVGWFVEGAVIDPMGDTVAVVEMSPSSACPDDFIARPGAEGTTGSAAVYGDTPTSHHIPPGVAVRPVPTGRWSSTPLVELLDMPGLGAPSA